MVMLHRFWRLCFVDNHANFVQTLAHQYVMLHVSKTRLEAKTMLNGLKISENPVHRIRQLY